MLKFYIQMVSLEAWSFTPVRYQFDYNALAHCLPAIAL